MKIKYKVTLEYDSKEHNINTLETLITNLFNKVIKDKESNTIHIWRKYITLDYIWKKDKLSTYIDLWNSYMRYDRTLQQLLSIVRDDPYIKRNFKTNK